MRKLDRTLSRVPAVFFAAIGLVGLAAGTVALVGGTFQVGFLTLSPLFLLLGWGLWMRRRWAEITASILLVVVASNWLLALFAATRGQGGFVRPLFWVIVSGLLLAILQRDRL